ncbi:hypothetical protein ACJRO7_009653 [Eucalyptus globulus]|uniref:Uncharacterized protein n=1 Tax=Eucalyptus globulus TaxID=34317 RepID=A0ABD3LF26_EUCGL
MESPGQWLKKALFLCKQAESGLYLDEEAIQISAAVAAAAAFLVSSKLHAYVKLPSAEVSTCSIRKPPRASKEAVGSIQERSAVTRTIESNTANQSNSRKKNKKSQKVVAVAEAVFQQGEHCSCQVHRHGLVSNCLSCCKIVCEQEGEGLCNFPQTAPVLAEAEAAAEAYAKRFVEYDWNSVACTTVIDDQSEHCKIEGNGWLSKEEKELLKEKKEVIEEAEWAKRSKVVMIFGLNGLKVLFNENEVSEVESRNSKPPEEREANGTKPNLTLRRSQMRLKYQIRVSRADWLGNHWGVQHERNKLKHFLVDDHLENS